MNWIILTSMIFCHIIDDFYLQGILANLKQKIFWKENYPDKLYEHDYIIALFIHSFSWSFMIMLPLFLYQYKNSNYIILLIINLIIHCLIDNLKANKFKINLTTDQLLHLFQIVCTYFLYIKIG